MNISDVKDLLEQKFTDNKTETLKTIIESNLNIDAKNLTKTLEELEGLNEANALNIKKKILKHLFPEEEDIDLEDLIGRVGFWIWVELCIPSLGDKKSLLD